MPKNQNLRTSLSLSHLKILSFECYFMRNGLTGLEHNVTTSVYVDVYHRVYRCLTDSAVFNIDSFLVV
jgi:hypothetical protein